MATAGIKPAEENARTISLRWHHVETVCLVALATYGIALRTFQYASNYSLHMDECLLALNLLDRDFHGLRQMLAYKQVGPLGFLWGEKLLMLAAGSGPLVMRFLPFFSSVLAVFAFCLLAKHFFSGLPLVFAVSLFSANQALVFYAATIKQYSVEVLIATLLILAVLPLFEKRPSRLAVGIAAASAILMWFSFSAVFVLAGIGAVLAAHHFRTRRNIPQLATVFLVWTAIFLPFYWFSIRPSASMPHMASDWTADYLPLHPVALVHWLGPHFAEFWAAAATWRIWPLAALFFLAGIWWVLRTRNHRAQVVLSALLVCLAAAALKKYPFASRLQLFLVPSAILLIAAGYNELLRAGRLRPVAHCFAVMLAAWCCFSAARTVFVQRSHLDSPREVVQYVRDHWNPGDHIYVDEVATAPFLYYNRDGHITDYTLNYSGTQVPAGRAWFLYFRTPWQTSAEYAPALRYLQAHGTEVAHFDAELHSAQLFVLDEKNATKQMPVAGHDRASAQKEMGPPPDGPSAKRKS